MQIRAKSKPTKIILQNINDVVVLSGHTLFISHVQSVNQFLNVVIKIGDKECANQAWRVCAIRAKSKPTKIILQNINDVVVLATHFSFHTFSQS